jgi:hypothetical protein
MRRVIDRKVYDTETAELIHEWENKYFPSDFEWCREELYRTPKGNFFILGSGGAKSKYAVIVGSGSWGGSSNNIIPISRDQAIDWLENHEGSEKIIELFPEEVEDA